MNYLKKIDRAFEKAPAISLNIHSKLVIMSDCHRGIGNSNDNFLKNETIFLAALQAYYNNGYTYIELGDGDELWENRSLSAIRKSHENVFALIEKFHAANRLHLLYGNHDYEKHLSKSQDPYHYYEGLLLQDSLTGHRIYLTHGHQTELLNSSFWRFTRFLVRYIWKPLELFGVLDPTSSAKNYRRKNKTEQRLNQWAIQNNAVLITGHTHRAMSGNRHAPLFNSGCCIYPNSITALELSNRQLSLVKWYLSAKSDQTIYVLREFLSQPVPLDELFP